MQIEQLAELTSDKLKALTPQELEAILKPYYNVTRPELARLSAPVLKNKSVSSSTTVEMNLTPQKRAALEALAAEGCDLSFLTSMKSKKKR